jgi:hypothetical protein
LAIAQPCLVEHAAQPFQRMELAGASQDIAHSKVSKVLAISDELRAKALNGGVQDR